MKLTPDARYVATWLVTALLAAAPLLATVLPTNTVHAVEATDEDEATAIRLAEMLRSARTVISRNQTLINDATIGDKGLTGDKVLAEAIALYQEKIGEDPTRGTDTRQAQLLQALMDAIITVMAENQSTINASGVGFKGFIPAVFARLVNERFVAQVGDLAQMKVTAPEYLVRNRKARPDAWESVVISERFGSEGWTKGQPYSELIEVAGRPAFRLLEPEYYAASCLSCHGEPAGETDITGYPKEGGQEGDLGAAISVVLFK
jgi:hypothetical protein